MLTKLPSGIRRRAPILTWYAQSSANSSTGHHDDILRAVEKLRSSSQVVLHRLMVFTSRRTVSED